MRRCAAYAELGIMPRIMNPNVWQLGFATGALARRIVHAFDAFASVGESPRGMLSSLCLANIRSPRFIVDGAKTLGIDSSARCAW